MSNDNEPRAAGGLGAALWAMFRLPLAMLRGDIEGWWRTRRENRARKAAGR